MLVVETIAKIRRAYFVQKKPVEEAGQGDLPDAACVAEGRAESDPLGRDRVLSSRCPRSGHGEIGSTPFCWRMTASRRANG
jgi:hypothetical protein